MMKEKWVKKIKKPREFPSPELFGQISRKSMKKPKNKKLTESRKRKIVIYVEKS